MKYPNKAKQYAIDVQAIEAPEAQLVFTVDYKRLDIEMVKHVIGFHMGDDDILDECKGYYDRALVLKIVQVAYRLMICEGWNERGLTSEFNDMEGWPGSDMITFSKASYDQFDIEWQDLTINEHEISE